MLSTLADALAAEGLGLEEAAGPSAAERAARAELVSASLQAAETTARLATFFVDAHADISSIASEILTAGTLLDECRSRAEKQQQETAAPAAATRTGPLSRTSVA
mmetsp:Transcript_27319/g.87759  ORF Transcript_27319/g.87759 Transcript_27319/m.87759 type:complete len:105 (+) Transcript_27319:14-328(+)